MKQWSIKNRYKNIKTIYTGDPKKVFTIAILVIRWATILIKLGSRCIFLFILIFDFMITSMKTIKHVAFGLLKKMYVFLMDIFVLIGA